MAFYRQLKCLRLALLGCYIVTVFGVCLVFSGQKCPVVCVGLLNRDHHGEKDSFRQCSASCWQSHRDKKRNEWIKWMREGSPVKRKDHLQLPQIYPNFKYPEPWTIELFLSYLINYQKFHHHFVDTKICLSSWNRNISLRCLFFLLKAQQKSGMNQDTACFLFGSELCQSLALRAQMTDIF